MLVGVGAVTTSDDGAVLIHYHRLAVDGPPASQHKRRHTRQKTSIYTYMTGKSIFVIVIRAY